VIYLFIFLFACGGLALLAEWLLWLQRQHCLTKAPFRPLTPTEALEQYEALFSRPLTDQEREHFLRGYRLGFQQGVSS
jgi:hypothetical protein